MQELQMTEVQKQRLEEAHDVLTNLDNVFPAVVQSQEEELHPNYIWLVSLLDNLLSQHGEWVICRCFAEALRSLASTDMVDEVERSVRCYDVALYLERQAETWP